MNGNYSLARAAESAAADKSVLLEPFSGMFAAGDAGIISDPIINFPSVIHILRCPPHTQPEKSLENSPSEDANKTDEPLKMSAVHSPNRSGL